MEQLIEKYRKILLVLIVIVLVLPALILGTPHPGMPTRDYRYKEASPTQVSSTDVRAMLEALAPLMNPSEISRLKAQLKGVSNLPTSNFGVLDDYIATLSDFTSNMTRIDALLKSVSQSISSGHTDQAAAQVRELQKLRNNAGELLKMLHSQLVQVSSQYGVDTTSQVQNLVALGTLYERYSKQIDQLPSFSQEQGLIPTVLSFNASKPEVYVNETFLVYGSLRGPNGTVLVNKNVTIAWGFNDTEVLRTNAQGNFETFLVFQINFPASSTQIEASFEPQYNDTKVYLPSTSTLIIQVAYRPSAITADISPTRVRPSDIVNVSGNLTTTDHEPLSNKTIMVFLDELFLRKITTGNNGTFSLMFANPMTQNNSTHLVSIVFSYPGYAPSNATLQVTVEWQAATISFNLNRPSTFSGSNLMVTGQVAYTNSTDANSTIPVSGDIVVLLDNVTYDRVRVNDNGTFASTIHLPIGLSFGFHTVTVQYEPDTRWVQTTRASRTIFVFNPFVIILAAAAIAAVSISIPYLLKRRRRVIPEPHIEVPIPKEKARVVDELPRKTLLQMVEAEDDHAKKISKAYNLARVLISQKLGEAPRDSETPSEYLSRVTARAPKIKDSLEHLTSLFELTEYSPFPVGQVESKKALEELFQLDEDIEK